MSGRIRICRTHDRQCYKSLEGPWACAPKQFRKGDCDPVSMVWSGDGVALLAIKECAACDGKGEFATASTQPTADGFPTATIIACRRCGGKGWEEAAGCGAIGGDE